MKETTTAPYEQWTVEELREELRAREMAVSGSKAELVDRMYATDEQDEAPLTEDDERQLRPVDVGEDEDEDEDETSDDAGKRDPRECVVDDGTPHMGRATPGAVICSAHAMHYKADGTPRE